MYKPNSCTCECNLEHDFWHEGGRKKNTIWSTMFGTRENTKKYRLWHEGMHQKTRFCARRRAPKNTIFGTREINKKRILCTREGTKKNDLEDDFCTMEKAKNTILCTKESTQNNFHPMFLLVTAIKTDSYFNIQTGKVRSSATCHDACQKKTKSNDLKTQTVENYTTVCRTGATASYSYSCDIDHTYSPNYFFRTAVTATAATPTTATVATRATSTGTLAIASTTTVTLQTRARPTATTPIASTTRRY